MSTYRSRRRTKRLIRNWIIFSVILAIVLSIGLYFLLRPKTHARMDDRISLTDISPSCEIIPFSKGCVYIDKTNGELYYIDKSSNKLWGFSGVTQQMRAQASDNRLAVYVSSKLQLISSEGELLYSRIYDYPIRDVRVSDNVVVMLQTQGAQTCLIVTDKNGDIKDTIVQQPNQTFLTYGIFSTDNKSVWLIYADTSSITPVYRFVTYRYEETKHITVSYSEFDQIIYAPIFLKDRISLLGSHEVINIDYTGKVLSRTRCVGYESKNINYGNVSKTLMLSTVSDSFEAKKRVLCIPDSGISYFIEEKDEIIATAVTDRYLYTFTPSALYSYDISSHFRTEYPLPEMVSSVCVNGKLCYLKGDKVYRLELK